jgi:TonB family protein
LNQLFNIPAIIFLLIIHYPNDLFAQTNPTSKQQHIDILKTNKTKIEEKDTIFFEIPDTGIYKGAFIDFEILPEFPGGDKALTEYVIKNTNYPQSAIKDSVEGRVNIRFAIDIDGSTCDTAVLRGIRPDLNNECMRVVMGMPKWKPGSTVFRAKKGLYRATVKWWYSIPFTFSLTNDDKIKGIIIRPNHIQ